jgi:hypothetical protein
MMISDVIAEAGTEHEIYFLLTAYLESVRFGDRFGLLPEHITRLPVSGPADVKKRLDDLRTECAQAMFQSNERTRRFITEALDVVGAARDRLTCLARPES